VIYQYPADLAAHLCSNWPEGVPRPRLPSPEVVTELLSTCYQASLLTEELQPVTFRMVMLEPEQIAALDGPPRGYHRLRFAQPRPLLANTLRKLSPAVEYSHSMLGVRLGAEGLEIWGMVHSGPRGTNSFYSSGRRFTVLPPCLLVSVKGPGAVTVSNGSRVIAKLSRGRVQSPRDEVLNARWIHDIFSTARRQTQEDYEGLFGTPAPVRLERMISQHLVQSMLRRSLQLLRKRGNGATLLIVPQDLVPELSEPNPYLAFRYAFADEEPRRRCPTLLMRLLHRLGQLHPAGSTVTWGQYAESEDVQIQLIDQAMEEFAELLANLASVDGAVVLTRRLELLGFGAEIAGNLPVVTSTEQALDIEATQTVPESTEGVGTRHRSAYRLCAQLEEVLAMVLSQDGRIQVVKLLHGKVTTWDQLSTGAGDF
jgi:hypothetical protein